MKARIIPTGTRFEFLEIVAAPVRRFTGKHPRIYYPCLCHRCGTRETVDVLCLRRGSAIECRQCALARRKRTHNAIVLQAKEGELILPLANGKLKTFDIEQMANAWVRQVHKGDAQHAGPDS